LGFKRGEIFKLQKKYLKNGKLTKTFVKKEKSGEKMLG
jgi:hypothetical protein